MSLLALDPPYVSVVGLAQAQRLVQYCVEHRCEITGRGIDDLQHLGDRGLSRQSLVSLGSALGKLTLQIGIDLMGIG